MRYRMGDLVELVTETNSNLEYGLDDIVGVTLEKQMIPTIANLKQTNLDDFIIVHPKDFVYNPRTHGKKIGLGFNTTNRCFISTWNNNTFRVRSDMLDSIMPEYLYLHFLRERWDREACFNAWGSSTVVLLWSSFCDMKINVPSISEQRKIVHDYQVITDRIELLRKMNDNLLSQCDAIYRALVMENDVNGKLSDVAEVYSGKRPENMVSGSIPLLGAGGIMDYISEFNYATPSLIIGRVGTHGVVQRSSKFWASDNTLVIVPKFYEFVFHVLRGIDYATLNRGSTQPLITQGDIKAFDIYIPEKAELNEFEQKTSNYMGCYSAYQTEIKLLERVKMLVVSHMN